MDINTYDNLVSTIDDLIGPCTNTKKVEALANILNELAKSAESRVVALQTRDGSRDRSERYDQLSQTYTSCARLYAEDIDAAG